MPRVLVVDDSLAVRNLLASMLSEQGWQVECVGDAETGAARALESPPDAVVADLWMPGLSGIQMCRLLRDEPATARVPVVLLTASGDARARFWAEESGADAFLGKRSVAELPGTLAALIKSERPRAAVRTKALVRTNAGSSPGRSIQARLGHLLDATLFDAVVCARLRRLALEHDAPDGLFVSLTGLMTSVLSYRWLALRVDSPDALGAPAFYLHRAEGDPGAAREAAQAIGLAATTEPTSAVMLADRAGEHRRALGTTGCVVARELAHRGGRLGTLAVGFEYASPSDEDARVLEMTVDEVSLALRMIGAFGAAQRLALTDVLTSLQNRRAASDALDRALAASARDGRPVSLVMGDVDRFKHVNDTAGHAAGDAVLRHVAGLLAKCARRSDVVARWGGEEFLLVLPSTPLEGAQVLADRLRRAIAISPATVPGGDRITVTASFGVATWRGMVEARDDLVARADHAMYQAKEAGRNRVVVDPLVPSIPPPSPPRVAR